MGNAVTCSLVDVVGTVTVRQTDGQTLEFVQPISASQVKKLHPGNWLVHYVSVHDPALGKQHGQMSMLQGNDELQAGQIYFLLPIPSHFRKEIFGANSPKQRSSSSNTSIAVPSAAAPSTPPATLQPRPASPASIRKQPGPSSSPKSHTSKQPFKLDGSKSRSSSRQQQQEPTLLFSKAGSPVLQHHVVRKLPSHAHRRCSSRQKFHVCDWRPTLLTIQEVF